jgi:hypothetical protein
VNSSEVAALAVFDLMFTQCDRHQQNIFMTEEGKLFAIDNDQVRVNARVRACVRACELAGREGAHARIVQHVVIQWRSNETCSPVDMRSRMC